MKIKELRELSEADLLRRADELRKELLNLHIQQVSQQLKNPLNLRSVRHEIARILTIIREGRKVEPRKK